MARQLNDWLSAYLEYTDETESPSLFHKWVGLTCISSALRKKVNMPLGRLVIYPNIYVVLVGPPGSRKTQAIKYGHDILDAVSDIIVVSDATTPEAFVQYLAESATTSVVNGNNFTHSSMSIISNEFEVFLGNKVTNSKMLVYLTDFWDCSDRPWTYKVKHGKSDTIPSVFLSLLAATTPESLGNALPSSAIGGGLTSRIIFAYAHKKEKKIAIPKVNARVTAIKKALEQDLMGIAQIAGSYRMSQECEVDWEKWYESYDDSSPLRSCTDQSFNGWYERKPTYVLKIAQLCAASTSDSMVIEYNHIERALSLLDEVEHYMDGAFSGVGRSPLAADMDMILALVRKRKIISDPDLRSLVWRDIDEFKFKTAMETLLKAKLIHRQYEGPKGETNSIWYCHTTK